MADERWRSGKKKKVKPKKKKKLYLIDAMRQFCKVEIITSKPEEGYEDVTLTIKFLNGLLEGQTFTTNIDREDYTEVW